MAGRGHRGIIDEEKAKLLAAQDLVEKQRLQAANWLEEELKQHIIMDADKPFTVPEHQRGQTISWLKFENKLKTLIGGSHLKFIDVPNRPFRAVYAKDGKYISAYGKVDDLPEFSVITVKYGEEPDFSIRHISHLDMPKMEFLGVREGFRVSDPNALRPGWRKVLRNWGEDANDPRSRGWRAVLMRGVHMGVWSPANVEAKFGRSNRASWATGMGHRDIKLRW
jgi:hypothetical protein